MGIARRHHRYSAQVPRSPRWRALRQLVLRRDGYRCTSCSARGRLEVDHVLPVRTHPDLAFEIDNLQALCPTCHSRKTRLECGFPDLPEPRKAWVALVRDLMGSTSSTARIKHAR